MLQSIPGYDEQSFDGFSPALFQNYGMNRRRNLSTIVGTFQSTHCVDCHYSLYVDANGTKWAKYLSVIMRHN